MKHPVVSHAIKRANIPLHPALSAKLCVTPLAGKEGILRRSPLTVPPGASDRNRRPSRVTEVSEPRWRSLRSLTLPLAAADSMSLIGLRKRQVSPTWSPPERNAGIRPTDGRSPWGTRLSKALSFRKVVVSVSLEWSCFVGRTCICTKRGQFHHNVLLPS